MGVSKVAIVYSTKQQVIRRITHFDRIADSTVARGWRIMTPEELAAVNEDHELEKHKSYCHPAETFVTIPHATYHSFTHPKHIHDHLGLKGIPSVTDRHAVLDKDGNVVAVVHADPEIDSHHPHRLVQHHSAVSGDTIINGVHKPRVP